MNYPVADRGKTLRSDAGRRIRMGRSRILLAAAILAVLGAGSHFPAASPRHPVCSDLSSFTCVRQLVNSECYDSDGPGRCTMIRGTQ